MEARTHLLLQISILRSKDMYFSYMFPKHGRMALSDIQPKKMLIISTLKEKQAV